MPLNIIRRLRASAAIMLMQLELYGRLAGIEWQQEKNRLHQLLVFSLVGLIFLSCCLLFLGFLAVALTWFTPYRIHTLVAVVVLYGLGAVYCYFRCKYYVGLNAQAFAATRAEIAADVAVLKSQL
jgi:uncharacterized membrane protein YqjE